MKNYCIAFLAAFFVWLYRREVPDVSNGTSSNFTEMDLKSVISSQSFPVVIEGQVDIHRENAALTVLCRNDDLYDLLETIQSVQDRFNDKHHYDWVFLNDNEFTVEFMYSVASLLGGGQSGGIKFGQVPPEHWGFPLWVNQTLARSIWSTYYEDNEVVYGQSESYRHMCRYFLGFIFNHELLKPYQFYWRIEPGVKYYCDIDYDVFQFMNENDILYGFTLSMFEYSHTIPTLWEAFRKFMSMNSFTAGPLFKFVENGDHTYNLCHFWTNFEIADMNIFRGSKYQSMFKYLDETGGFYYERWGDAPIHTLFVLTFLDPEEVWWFGDIGYTHSPYTQCPRATEIRDMGKCSCDPNTDFLFHELSCTNHFLKNREAALSNDQFQIEADF